MSIPAFNDPAVVAYIRSNLPAVKLTVRGQDSDDITIGAIIIKLLQGGKEDTTDAVISNIKLSGSGRHLLFDMKCIVKFRGIFENACCTVATQTPVLTWQGLMNKLVMKYVSRFHEGAPVTLDPAHISTLSGSIRLDDFKLVEPMTPDLVVDNASVDYNGTLHAMVIYKRSVWFHVKTDAALDELCSALRPICDPREKFWHMLEENRKKQDYSERPSECYVMVQGRKLVLESYVTVSSATFLADMKDLTSFEGHDVSDIQRFGVVRVIVHPISFADRMVILAYIATSETFDLMHSFWPLCGNTSDDVDNLSAVLQKAGNERIVVNQAAGRISGTGRQ